MQGTPVKTAAIIKLMLDESDNEKLNRLALRERLPRTEILRRILREYDAEPSSARDVAAVASR
jgi:hypothetical protein